jgi:hypothetical protein
MTRPSYGGPTGHPATKCSRSCHYSIQFNSLDIYSRAGLTAQVPILKPAQKHKYNTKTVQVHKNGTLNRQNKNNVTKAEK